ncbi:MAG TPA: sigma-70 family RNA polymerase sigma factor [Fimbriiglobus sp.]|jgi:RNA polymerase sigma-70 factor (ECF subfamily)|nr:sigma-70 family RNA polymerase sigma factor [Fimbriiglobus sp.]
MSRETPFDDLLGQLRRGDPDAAAELVRRYEPAIRAAVRGRMADTRLRRLFDSMDVCQTVLASFFARVALGQYVLNSADDLVKLLVSMARNKLAKQVTRHRRAGRDYRRTAPVADGHAQPVSVAPDPARQVAAAELVAEVYRLLSPDERRLVELRQQGHDWPAIAESLGGSAEALRKQHARAVARVAAQLEG